MQFEEWNVRLGVTCGNCVGVAGRSQRDVRDHVRVFDFGMAFTPVQERLDATRMSTRANRLAVAVREMERHLTRPGLSLGWLARRIGISQRQLQRDFAGTGTSVVRTLREKRLRLAAEQLALRRRAAGRPSITDVALGSGFNDISNFNRAFKQRFGCSPTDFRRALPAPALTA